MMGQAQGAGWRRRIGRDLRQIGPVRLAATLVLLALAAWVAVNSWSLPLAGDAERALYDLRFDTSAVRIGEPDSRITLVVYNDQTLADLGKRSPLDRLMLARALTAIDRMGARAIGIDILIDQQQAEDAALIGAFRGMRTPTYLAFTTNQANPDQMEAWQEQFLRDFFRRIGPRAVRPASIKSNPDLEDGVVRRWPLPDPHLPPPVAAAMSQVHPEFRGYAGAIDFQLPTDRETRRFPSIAIEELARLEDPAQPPELRAALGTAFAEQIRGRYVLIGGDIHDVDDFETPMTRFDEGWMKGIEVIAQMLAQQLDGRLRPPLPAWSLWLAAALVVIAGGITAAFEPAGWRLALALAVEIGLIVWLPFQLHAMGMDTLDLPAAGWGAGWLLAFIGVGTAARAVGSEQRKFAQSALGKYLPPDIAARIMRDPDQLSLKGEKRIIYTLFTDLEDFTRLSHAITPEQLSELLNTYLDLMSDIVLAHGGTIDKFVGDAVIAFWGAPIARDDDGDRALAAAIAMYQAGKDFAASAGAELPPVGATRVGLHRGEAVVGNFGGEGRIQYTALGDGMNTGARLESANKSLKTTVLVSGDAKDGATLDVFRPMGRIAVSGRATPIAVWEPVPHMDEALRARLNALWLRFDGGDPDALVQLQSIADEQEGDAALKQFVYRCRIAGPGGHFVLDSK
jgi:adenylate cyclase